MSRIARIAAGAVLAGIALSAAPASAEFPPDCKVTLEERRFAGPGGGTWSMTVPDVTCTL